MIDVNQGMLDPTSVFKNPEEVVADEYLSREQKTEILRRWEYDARELEVAEEEAGMAVRLPDMFDRVLQEPCTRWVWNWIRSTVRQRNSPIESPCPWRKVLDAIPKRIICRLIGVFLR